MHFFLLVILGYKSWEYLRIVRGSEDGVPHPLKTMKIHEQGPEAQPIRAWSSHATGHGTVVGKMVMSPDV